MLIRSLITDKLWATFLSAVFTNIWTCMRKYGRRILPSWSKLHSVDGFAVRFRLGDAYPFIKELPLVSIPTKISRYPASSAAPTCSSMPVRFSRLYPSLLVFFFLLRFSDYTRGNVRMSGWQWAVGINARNFLTLLAAEFEVGTLAPSTPCTFTVDSEHRRSGNILSPTYPGTYPKDLGCSYQFIGKRSQRVRLEFRDFDLFFGGPQYVICTSAFTHTYPM